MLNSLWNQDNCIYRPRNWSELPIDQIPTDPYGGEFYIMSNGRVYTTSKLVLPKKKR